MTPAVLNEHFNRLLDTINAVPRDYVIFCEDRVIQLGDLLAEQLDVGGDRAELVTHPILPASTGCA